MAVEFNPAAKSEVSTKKHGAFLALDTQKKPKFDEQFTLAYGGATGYVSPPALNEGGSCFNPA